MFHGQCSFCRQYGHHINKCNHDDLSKYLNKLEQYIFDNAHKNTYSATYLGYTYELPLGIEYDSEEADQYFAGT